MAKGASLSIEIPERKAILRAFKALGETDAPLLKDAVDKGGDMVAGAARRRAKGGIGGSIQSQGVRGVGATVTARVVAKHPGSKPMEFGRQMYYEGYQGYNVKGGRKVRRKGQKAQPYFGVVKGNAAAGEVGPKLKEMFGDAFEREFERLANG